MNISEIVKKEIKNVIKESTIGRATYWIENYEIAVLTAWRDSLNNVTDNTFVPDDKNIGDNFSTKEKKMYNRELKAKLLQMGYGVTNVRGTYREGGADGTDVQEESFLVVNLKDDAGFKAKIFQLSEYYNQDSFMYSPKGSDEAVLVGTNNCDFPGYGEEIPTGKLQKNVSSMFMTRVGNKGFSFADDADVYQDKPLTFNDRKRMRMNEKITKHLETFDRASIGAKYAILHEARKCNVKFV